jgi:hypothetical protein
MRAIVLSVAAFLGLGGSGYAQSQSLGPKQGSGLNQPQTLRGVYAPPSMSALGQSGKSSLTPSGSELGAVGSGPRVTLPDDPAQGQTLPSEVSPRPIPDRPGYGAAVINGHRVIVELSSNRIFQVLD